jgi:hypothetical protein
MRITSCIWAVTTGPSPSVERRARFTVSGWRAFTRYGGQSASSRLNPAMTPPSRRILGPVFAIADVTAKRNAGRSTQVTTPRRNAGARQGTLAGNRCKVLVSTRQCASIGDLPVFPHYGTVGEVTGGRNRPADDQPGVVDGTSAACTAAVWHSVPHDVHTPWDADTFL